MCRTHCLCTLTLAVGLSLLSWSSPGRAEESAPDAKAVDKAVYTSLRDVINRGADLYNSGDWAGCYRLYEGSLMSLKPLLAHRPELQKAIDAGLVNAERNPQVRRAFVLREVLDQIRTDVNPNPKPVQPTAKTLWERLGGEKGVGAVVDEIVATVAKDPKVDFFRDGKYKLDAAGVARLKRLLVEQISSLTGGPLKYDGLNMKEAHKGMKITDAQFDAFAADVKAVLEKNKVAPADLATLVSAVNSYRKDIVEAKAEPLPEPKTLWQRLGGEKGVTAMVDEIAAAEVKDPKVDFFRGGTVKLDAAGVARLKRLLVEQISSLTGGPLKYDGLNMKEAHKGMKITDAQFDAHAANIKAVLEKNKVAPADVTTIMNALNGFRKDIVEPAKKPDDKEKGGDKGAAATGSVSGKVTLNGKPVPAGTFGLHALEGGKSYSAKIQADGTYEIKDVPPGKYKVAVKDATVPKEYADPKTTPLLLEIKAGANSADLKLMD